MDALPRVSTKNLGTKEQEYTNGQRFLDLLPGLGSIVMIVFGAQGVNDCEIGSLPAYAITFGSLNVISALFKFAFRIPTNPRLQKKDHMPTQISGIFGIAMIAVAIWGAVLTWGKAGAGFGGELDCPQNLYICGFISSLLPIAIVSCMILWSIVAAICLGGRSCGQAEEKNAGNVEEKTVIGAHKEDLAEEQI